MQSSDGPPVPYDASQESVHADDDVPDPGSLADQEKEQEEEEDDDEPQPLTPPPLPPRSPSPEPLPDLLRRAADDGPVPSITDKLSDRPEIRTVQLFIRELQTATLEESGLDADSIHRLRNPITEIVDISDDKDLRLSIDIFLADTYGSEKAYENSRKGIHRREPAIEMLSHHDVKNQITELTGVAPLSTDMCPRSCLAYTGKFKDDEKCHDCGQPR
ncbi:hypothetical protein C8J57DRAFT_1182705, partial [Mycena rebaudengoi]